MNGLALGFYGIYLLLVGYNGNSKALVTAVQEDAPGFLPWAIAIGVLTVLNDNEYTNGIAKPFIFLLLLTFVLKNFPTLRAQVIQIWNMAQSSSSNSSAVNNASGTVNNSQSLFPATTPGTGGTINSTMATPGLDASTIQLLDLMQKGMPS